MRWFRTYLLPVFFTGWFYRIFAGIIGLFIIAYLIPALFIICQVLLVLFALLVLTDYLLLFIKQNGIEATRILPQRFSNGDENPVTITLTNNYPFRVHVQLIDEVPVQFQLRDNSFTVMVAPGETRSQTYMLRPVERGEYLFHHLNVYIRGPFHMVIRRVRKAEETMVKVYPSYKQLRQFELIAFSDQLSETGNRKIRRIGHSLEFEQIRDYVTGDDIRSVNWKATARKGGHLMVNNFSDERSQQIYCVIDKGRAMKMPFRGMTLLDYSINAALVLSKVALLKADKAGLVTFSGDTDRLIPAERRAGQMELILEHLYHQQTRFDESSYEKLYNLIRKRIPQRSLLVLFSNFESLTALKRELAYLKSLAGRHLVLVVFFENTELSELINTPATDIQSLYTKTIAEQFHREKKLIIRELKQHGILTLLTPPEELSIHVVNKYLEIKARQAL